MKNQLFTITLMLFSFTFLGFYSKAQKIDYNFESTVVLNIKKHSFEDIQVAQSLLLKNTSIRVDYQCLASGVIVCKIGHNFTQGADVKHFVYKALSSKIAVSRINILFVDIRSKTNQC
jgi:hypothetical protein